MSRIKLTIQYDGREYFGWQRQKEQPKTIQETLENVLSDVVGECVAIEASGRTDAGVSAYAQIAHFDTTSNLPLERLPFMCKHLLPKEISILKAEYVSNTFHSRFDAHQKTYVYKLYTNKLPLPLFADRLYVNHSLDVKAMKKASKKFLGEHDFTSFTKAESLKDNCVRNIYQCKITQDDNCIDIYITGSGFLHNMVRIIVGTLLAVGENKLKPKEIKTIFDAKNRCDAYKTLLPYYLYLVKVEY